MTSVWFQEGNGEDSCLREVVGVLQLNGDTEHDVKYSMPLQEGTNQAYWF